MVAGLRIGNGIDVHPFSTDEDRPLVLAGVTIPGHHRLEGHSDADVVAHTVIDAVLGAGAMGDIGSHFGNDTEELEGADSLVLLSRLAGEIRKVSWRVTNLDVTVVAQVPKLSAHRDDMRHNLAAALGIHIDAVSVKFTTTDHLGAIGRGEGIACWASLLARR